MAEIIIAPTVEKVDVKIPDKLIFGRTFTTHLFEMTYDEELGGWQNPTIKKFSELSINPAALVFHYGQSIFEGLKAYKQDDGRIALFRPEKNFERLNSSAKRMCIPEIDIDFVLNALKELISLDRDWIPTKPGHSLYIRPLVFAYDPFLGVRPGGKYKFFIMLSPVGPYYPEGFKPVPILASDKYVRAVRGGVGDCKTAGNYAASLLAQAEAKKEGFTQVLYLDALERKYLEEVGTMNIFVHFEDEVATPGLGGTILPGITRMSVLEILKDWGYNVNERNISIDEVIESHKNGKLKELFGTGTAAVISSVGRLKYKDFEAVFNNGEVGELGQKLYKELTDLHYGRKEDLRGWLTYID
ncbi:MAG: branched-chain amino acid aminotransferase [Melioribacteraceae bacterium]|nr:branched-chain amino acid aminotransferase [Melioribacteraceae bacterium]MDD3559302.1 branched-chain amino acid aminotransferase [Melioribacteraceae bacterium]